MHQDVLLEVIREFTGTILNPYDLPALLHRVADHATAVVDAVGAGIMLEDTSGDLKFAAASAERIIEAERTQQRVESGACFEAYATNRIIIVDDLGVMDQWPEYRDRVVALGLMAVVGVPLNAFGQTIGVINIYRDRPTHWSTEEVEAAEILAAMAAGYIVNANQMRSQNNLTEQLHAAIESRDVIGQAKGILMAHKGVDADAAFELLRKASQAQNRKLREIAEMVVDRRAEF